MEELTLFETYPIVQLISYIITVVIGGVGFKFYKEYTNTDTTRKQMQASENQNLIENLNTRVTNLTNNVQKFEEERKELHKRELDRTKDLAEARADVRILTERVKHLEEIIRTLTSQNKEYREKLGQLNE